MTAISVTAPAKLNLMLHITGQRDDGYHLLETVFQFIDLCDDMTFQLRDDGQINCTQLNSSISADEDITVRAAKMLQSAYSVHNGIDISINKNIPIGGGLGGGSSNAASCLLVLNQLWKLDLPMEKLSEIGLQLGADVPVFIYGQAAWAKGVGETLEAIQLPENTYMVINPGISVSTGEIFGAKELTRNNESITIRAFLDGAGKNVCEAVARQRYPAIDQAMNWLDQFAKARLTGTGACIFASFDSVEKANAVKSQIPDDWTGYVVQALNKNPVHQQLALL